MHRDLWIMIIQTLSLVGMRLARSLSTCATGHSAHLRPSRFGPMVPLILGTVSWNDWEHNVTCHEGVHSLASHLPSALLNMVSSDRRLRTDPLAPKLPLEIVTKILRGASRKTLLAALRVDTTFNSAALPLLYSHLYFDPRRERKRGKISTAHLRHVKTLDIFNHDAEHCAALKFDHSPDVIRFHYNDTIECLHGWHNGTPCPLLSLKPESLVFLGFDATKAPPDPKAFKTPIYPDTKNRVVVWDISDDLNNKGYNAAVKNVFFPPEKDDPGLEARLKQIQKGTGGEPKPDDLTRSEIMIFANNSTNRHTGLGFLWWFKSWAKEHSRRKHIVVNLQALNPGNTHYVDSLEEDIWKWCANKSEEMYIPQDENDEDKYRNVRLLAYNSWPRIEKCRPLLLRYLTKQEIQKLLPPPKTPKTASTKKANASTSKK